MRLKVKLPLLLLLRRIAVFQEIPYSSPGPLVILFEMDNGSRSDPGGHRKVLPFDWLTGEQKIFVNYYDYAASIRGRLQRTKETKVFKKHLSRSSDRKQQSKEPVVLWLSWERGWKSRSFQGPVSDLLTAELPQIRSCPKFPIAYQFSHRAT